MSSDTDIFLDRRRLKRHAALWRAGVIVGVIVIAAVSLGRDNLSGHRQYVASLGIDGLIVSDTRREQILSDLIGDEDVLALLLLINSPGGETAASEGTYMAVRAVAATKPVVAVMDGVAASGGYMIALAADRIFARESTITGSIGVVLEATNLVGLMDMMGVESEIIRSGPLKAQPNIMERMPPEARSVNQALVNEIHAMFKQMIVERRGIDPNVVDALSDGRVFSGASAKSNGLIDALGGSLEARRWLEERYAISAAVPERSVDIPAAKHWLDWFLSIVFHKSYLAETLTLDGLVSVWHPFTSIK